MSQEIIIQKSTIKKSAIIIGLLAILVIGIFSVKGFSNAAAGGSTVKPENSNSIQTIKVRMSGNQYIFEPSTLKKDVPARLEIDLSTVTGCYRGIVIPGFNIRKSVRQGDSIIEFLPDKEGTFGVTCSMGMGQGRFSVSKDGSGSGSGIQLVNAQPTPQVQQAQQQQTPSSCGMGGCGCGG